jgi:hypothetical protein
LRSLSRATTRIESGLAPTRNNQAAAAAATQTQRVQHVENWFGGQHAHVLYMLLRVGMSDYE